MTDPLDTEIQTDEGGEIAHVNNLEAQGDPLLTRGEPEATSAAQEEVAAASPPVPAVTIDTKDTLQMGTQMKKVEEADRQYTDELVQSQPAKPKSVSTEMFIKMDKAGAVTFAKAYDGENYVEFALEDATSIHQSVGGLGVSIAVTLVGGETVFFGASKLDAEEFLKKWRGVRSTQRR